MKQVPSGVELLRDRRGLMARIAEQLGISGAAVRAWETVPLEHLLEVERITGIDRAKLRPDLARLFDRRAA